MSQDVKYKEFGARLRMLRKQAGLTQAGLAEEADISCVYVNKLERGLAAPSLDVLGRLAKSLDTDAAGLLSSEDAAPSPAPPGPSTSPYMGLYLTGDNGKARRLVFQTSETPIPPLPKAGDKKRD